MSEGGNERKSEKRMKEMEKKNSLERNHNKNQREQIQKKFHYLETEIMIFSSFSKKVPPPVVTVLTDLIEPLTFVSRTHFIPEGRTEEGDSFKN